MMQLCLLLLLLIINSFVSSTAQASACCASGVALPSLITGDKKGAAFSSLTVGSVIGEIRPGYNKTYLWPKERDLISQTLSVGATYQISDFQQLGFSTNVIKKSYRSQTGFTENSTGLGDSSLNYGFEFLPETEYSLLKPRAFISVRLSLPTGKSQFESTSSALSDVTGINQWGLAVGLPMVKIHGPWDFFLFPEMRGYLKDTFSRQGQSYSAAGFYGGILSIGGGYFHRMTKMRYGLNIAPQFVGVRQVQSKNLDSKTAVERYTDTTFTISYVANEEYSVHLFYSDQTLIGPVSNTTLARSVGVRLQKFWN